MPELPEVETTRRGIAPHLQGKTVADVIIRNRNLRWPVSSVLPAQLKGQRIRSIGRRGKYILLEFANGTLLLHLGMSGSLRIVPDSTPAAKHDHFDLVLENNRCLRLRDPRRFGSISWTRQEAAKHRLLRELGPEPLANEFNAEYLYTSSRRRKLAIKNHIMNSHIVVGVGNIYANEALFLSGIRPTRAAGKISRKKIAALVDNIKQVLRAAIEQGGTTLRDFTNSDGKPGYFAQQLNVYNRKGESCPSCGASIKHVSVGQRSSYYCPVCQA